MPHKIEKINANEPDDRPLPLIVAEKWDFKLDYAHLGENYLYAIQDWIAGLTSSSIRVANRVVTEMRRTGRLDMVVTKHQLPYTAKDGKTYLVDFTDDKGLYLIAQNLKVMKGRPLLAAIQQYLADAGVIVDKFRRKPESMVEALDPDKALDAVIRMYKRQGKTDEWIRMRINTKIQRLAFTSALGAAVAEIAQSHYGQATNEIYFGLWRRTAKKLREEMGLKKNANLRDHQPMAALFYQGLAEDACARELGEYQELTWGQALYIIQDAAHFIGKQARAYGQRYGVDLATGKLIAGVKAKRKNLPQELDIRLIASDPSWEEEDETEEIWHELLVEDAAQHALPRPADETDSEAERQIWRDFWQQSEDDSD